MTDLAGAVLFMWVDLKGWLAVPAASTLLLRFGLGPVSSYHSTSFRVPDFMVADSYGQDRVPKRGNTV